MVAGVRPRSRSYIPSGQYRTLSVYNVVMQRRIVGEHERSIADRAPRKQVRTSGCGHRDSVPSSLPAMSRSSLSLREHLTVAVTLPRRDLLHYERVGCRPQ